MAKLVMVIPHHHMDPVWRRAFDRPAQRDGIIIRPYAEVEAAIFNRWLELASAGYTLCEGQAAVWRLYLQRNKKNRPAVAELAKSGNLDMVFAGETIGDTNMPAAEGIVRNYLLAWPTYADLAGDDHPALKIGWLNDAFGNSPNMPQVLRQCGCLVAARLSYRSVPKGQSWLGIDGTSIPVLDNYPFTSASDFNKHLPCPTCKGHGCKQCGKSGMVWADVTQTAPLAEAIDKAVAMSDPWAVVQLDFEEHRPAGKYVDIVRQAAHKYEGTCEVRFGTLHEVMDRVDLAGQSVPAAPHDLNPGMPGCYVTRIRNKQRTRQMAYELLAVEASLASEAWQKGKPKAPPKKLDDAWRGVVFNQFHDAITGTHIDQANYELMDMLDAAQGVTRKYGIRPPRAPRLGGFEKPRDNRGSIQLGKLDVHYDLYGIDRLLVDGQDLFGAAPRAVPMDRPFRVGELVLEDDFGDAWGMRKAHAGSIQGDLSAVALGDWNTAVEVSSTALRWTGHYHGSDPRIARLKWTVTATISKDGRRLNFMTDVEWDTHSKRLRVVVPVQSGDPTATWEVPFGFIDRTFDASQLDYSDWKSNTMEFPALHWVRKRIDDDRGVAILNKGLPCFRWTPGRWDFSLLRSPEMPLCSYPAGIEFWDIDGWRDMGHHEFEYAIWPYTDGLKEAELTRAGYAYNLPLPLGAPFAIEGQVIVTAWKFAQDGKAWILRVQEIAGADTGLAVDLGAEHTVTPCDLLERPTGQPIQTQRYEASLHKHEIHTVRIV